MQHKLGNALEVQTAQIRVRSSIETRPGKASRNLSAYTQGLDHGNEGATTSLSQSRAKLPAGHWSQAIAGRGLKHGVEVNARLAWAVFFSRQLQGAMFVPGVASSRSVSGRANRFLPLDRARLVDFC